MLRMCVYMHSRFVENHLIRILEDGPLIFEGVLSQIRQKSDVFILNVRHGFWAVELCQLCGLSPISP
jgi:hypothetical protein